MDHKICGVGPGMSFANTVLAKDPSIGVIGLVPCAVGGTTLGEWSRGRKLYNDTIERTKAALKDGGAPRALLWFQGESDTSNLENAKSYNTHFEQFIAHVRCDLQLPTLPVVQVVVASGDGPFVKEVRESQMAVKLPELKKVDAWEVSLLADNVHLTVDSAIKVGHMMADAYLQFPSQ
ncbi:hypothetical protein C2S51_019146 [Perilla frutescens var. frutescens]|nr:hypothetical protein C2S51_019146 [Perilla frutescens var. frutescens]